MNRIKIVLSNDEILEYETDQEGIGITPNGFLAVALSPHHQIFFNPNQVKSYEFIGSKIQKAQSLPIQRPVQ